MEKLLLGIDIGTSACKVAVFDLQGKVLSQAAKEYKVYYPAPGFVEQNPDEWWEAVCAAIKETLAYPGIDAARIAGIGIDGQSWSAIPINKKGEVLSNTPIWMDTRAADICRETVDRIGFDRIFELSGNSFEPTYSTPKILWFKKNMPDVYSSTYKFLQSNSFIAFKLTGQISQDLSQGYGIHSFDMKKGKWDEGFCEELGFDGEKLPEIYQCHDVIGEVTAESAAQTGLAKGTPVVAGGLDACCGTLGAGVVKVGQTQEQGGQAGGMSICLDSSVAHPKLILSFHVVPDLWLLQGGTVGGGGAIKWFKQEFGAFEEMEARARGSSPFKIMDEEAEKIPAGSEGLLFLPYMAGERSPLWDRKAKGVFFGLDYSKTRAHMIRAVMEGCAFALQHNMKTAEEIGVGADELIAMGGAANSRLWTQIKADITGKTIKVPTSDTATTLGAAILAGVGTGLYKSFEQAVEDTIVITRTHQPDMKAHSVYEKSYGIYLELYEKLKDTMQKV
ncbi:xylulokinase [Anaerobacterium chartisolvens]|uniref:Xylulokinase n=1 Tax=Anaerobacterium chartisolvens TaxID=1297424 RepID=A0A369B303_9FIRM|nr:FGGY-family carbohydrate kinase [Anaerobacterium chartisolvens]RCX14826.1 xylulokinase [Anaerobacterium chartisolvens]